MMADLSDLSANPGRETRNLLIPITLAGTLVIVVLVWWLVFPHEERPAVMIFESEGYGCRFEYPGVLDAGPNYLRTPTGSMLTIERHSLEMAKAEFVLGLPDVLFSQVMIQLRETYSDLSELSREVFRVAGSRALEVRLEGNHGARRTRVHIAILIFASDDWVYVLRSYSPVTTKDTDRALFQRVWETWTFLPEKAAGDGEGA